MQLIALNLGMPRAIVVDGQTIMTGIFKSPVAHPVQLEVTQLQGDGQADRVNHGGEDKAVYAYPHEHYAYWQQALGCRDFTYGQFGENFTVTGLLEDAVRIGDVFEIGGAQIQISQPRTPCYKLSLRMGVPGFHRRFAESLRVGFYFRVLRPGAVCAGDRFRLLSSDPEMLSVKDMFALKLARRPDASMLRQAAQCGPLAAVWRESFQKRLAALESQDRKIES